MESIATYITSMYLLLVQSLPIISQVVSSNPVHGKAYSMQHYVIKFVSDLRQVGGFLLVLPISSTNQTDCHDIAEILLKVVLNTISHTLTLVCNLIYVVSSNIFSDVDTLKPEVGA